MRQVQYTASLIDHLYSDNLNNVLPAHLQELWAQHKRNALAEDSSNTSEESSSTAACDIGTTLQHWHLQSPAIVALQSRGHSSALQTSIFRTVIDLTPRHLKEYAEMNTRLLQLLRNAIQQGDDQSVEAVSVFMYLLPGMLLSPDGAVDRDTRFILVRALQLDDLVEKLLRYTKSYKPSLAHALTDPGISLHATKQGKTPNGTRAAATTLTNLESFVPNTSATLAIVQAKHPPQRASPDDLAAACTAALQRSADLADA